MATRVSQVVVAWCVATLCLIATQTVRAQAPEVVHQHDRPRVIEGPTVSLDRLLREALDNNPELVALRDQIAVARQRPAQERGLSPPMAEAQIWQWPVNTVNPANTNMYMFMVSQDLPGRGKRDARAVVAEKDITLAETDVTIRVRQIVNEIKQGYLALYIARKSTDVHFASVDVLRQMADAAQAKYAAGKGSQQDVLKPVLELSKLHSDVIMHDQEADIAAARLNILLNHAPDRPIGPLDEPREASVTISSAELQQLAIAHHPELERVRVEIARADAEIASSKLERKPDFTVQGGYLVMPNQTDGLLAKVGITWPNAPWARARIDAKIAEQSAAAIAVKSRQRSMENMIRLAVQEAYVRVTAAQERASLLRTTILPQSQQAFDAARSAFQVDRADLQTVLDTERAQLDAQLDYFKALTDFTQALADLERAVGTELPPGTITPVPATEGR